MPPVTRRFNAVALLLVLVVLAAGCSASHPPMLGADLSVDEAEDLADKLPSYYLRRSVTHSVDFARVERAYRWKASTYDASSAYRRGIGIILAGFAVGLIGQARSDDERDKETLVATGIGLASLGVLTVGSGVYSDHMAERYEVRAELILFRLSALP